MALFPSEKKKAPKLANHDLGHYFKTSMPVGTLVPIYVRNMVAGETLNLDVQSLVNTQALLSPLYGKYRLKVMAFFGGTSLYIPQLWRNGSMVNSEGKMDVNYPVFHFIPINGSNVNEQTVNPSSLLAYLGYGANYFDAALCVHSGESPTPSLQNAIPLLLYWDIWRHYFCNRQEDRYPFMNGLTSGTDPGTALDTVRHLDDLYLTLPRSGGDISTLLPPPMAIAITRASLPLAGFALGTFMPDRTNVILNSSFYRNNVSSVKVNITSDSFTIDQLVVAKKLWNSANGDMLTNQTFRDWVRVHYGVTPKIMDDMPTFLGATAVDVNFEEIRATTRASVDGDQQYVGDKASSALGYGATRRFVCSADRPGYLMVLAQLVPSVDYYQYTKRFTQFTKLSDEFRPEYNNIGLQDVLVSDLTTDFSKYAATPNSAPVNNPFKISLGKQPAYIEDMTELNTVRGTFCTTENSWVLTRNFNTDGDGDPFNAVEPSAYIIPRDWQQPFAIQSSTQQNFLVQFYLNARLRSPLLKRLMPKF